MLLRILLVDNNMLDAHPLAVALHRKGCTACYTPIGNGSLVAALSPAPDAVVFGARLDPRTACRASQGIHRVLGIPIIIEVAPNANRRWLRDLKNRLHVYFIETGRPTLLAEKLCGLLLRAPPRQPADLTHGGLTLCPAQRRVLLDGRPLALTPLEFDLLHRLMRTPNTTVPCETLMREVWGQSNAPPSLHTLRCHITGLRGKLGEGYRERLVSVRREGYLFRWGDESPHSPHQSDF